MTNPFEAADMAAGYASARPPVHPVVISMVKRRLGLSQKLGCALDVGCGAGLSTRPLASLARSVAGVEPSLAMLRFGSGVAPEAGFVAGFAEQLPFRAGCADLVTAAGSLNYVADLDRSLAEIERVLAPGGMLVAYDFSQGRWFRHSPALEEWFAEFRRRYPPPTGSARPLDPALLATAAPRFVPAGDERFRAGIVLDAGAYLRYMMTETNVASAIAAGTPRGEIQDWCRATLEPVFAGAEREVLFEGYIAYFRNGEQSS
ncbi:MAG: class I SAM-dependent methyltransferase [Bryobacteraceae bacterium]